jgi:hypothetical protein
MGKSMGKIYEGFVAAAIVSEDETTPIQTNDLVQRQQ